MWKSDPMKATLEIPDDLYKRIKALAALRGKASRVSSPRLFKPIWNERLQQAHYEAGKVSSVRRGGKKLSRWMLCWPASLSTLSPALEDAVERESRVPETPGGPTLPPRPAVEPFRSAG